MKKAITAVLSIIAAIGLVSATLVGLSLGKHFSVTNANQILSDETTYALPSFFNASNTTKCPPGDFDLTNHCTEDDSGKQITGWEILLLNATTSNSTNTSIELTHGNFDDGCASSGCGKSTKTEIFTTPNYNGEFTDWNYVGSISSPPNSNFTSEVIVGEAVDAVLVARGSQSDQRPDPRWFLLEVFEY